MSTLRLCDVCGEAITVDEAMFRVPYRLQHGGFESALGWFRKFMDLHPRCLEALKAAAKERVRKGGYPPELVRK